jgi:hypothetical protein
LSRLKIFAIYTVVDLLIVAGVLWCFFQRWPVSKYLVPAAILFVLNGAWLVVAAIKSTPPGSN